ncbi:hypothetical protein ABPG75_007762 [Micractinium tetrahymenae]
MAASWQSLPPELQAEVLRRFAEGTESRHIKSALLVCKSFAAILQSCQTQLKLDFQDNLKLQTAEGLHSLLAAAAKRPGIARVHASGLDDACRAHDLATLAMVLQRLPAVERLHCSCDGLTAHMLPTSAVAAIPNLRSLFHTHPAALPAQLSSLSQLTQLECEIESSTELPAHLSSLQALQHFEIWGPTCILPPGEEVRLRGLQVLPACRHLRCLHVSFLWLEDLAWVGGLTMLTRLELSNLHEEPGAAGHVDEYGHCLEVLPASVASFAALTRLYLTSNELLMLPTGPYQQSLVELCLDDDPVLQIDEVLPVLEGMPCLSLVNLESHYLELSEEQQQHGPNEEVVSTLAYDPYACRQLLPVLEGMPRLLELSLEGMALSEEQRQELWERLPRCSMEF